MKALLFDKKTSGDPALHLSDIPIPDNPDEALIRVSLAGICNTDLEIVKGYMGFLGVPGHEFVGFVEKSPDPAWVGKRVTGEINVGCGVCPCCVRGDPRHCADRTVLGILGRNGAFAEYVSLPLANLHEIPAEISDQAAVFIEPLAAACEIAAQVDLRGKRVLILGDGKLGQLIGQALPFFGAKCTLVGKHKQKLALVQGATKTVLLADFAQNQAYDVVVEATGSPSGFETALRCLKPRGTLVLKSTYAGGFDFNPASLVINEITLIGSRCGRFPPAIELLRSGNVDPVPMIEKVFPLAKGEEAFATAGRPGALKIILDMS